MTSSPKATTDVPIVTVGRETLDETPQRALKLLRAIGTSLPIRAALASRGYGEEDHQEGWSFLHEASGYHSAPGFGAIDVAVRDAIHALDAWDEGGFRIVHATLDRRYPEVASKVLEGIGPSTGAAAVVGVKVLLDRLDQLERSKHGDEHAALALLAKRGIDKAERKRLRALVEEAESVAPARDVAHAVVADAQKSRADEHLKALVELRAWYEEWSEIARVTVKRRDHLILLGLAKRKAKAPAAPAPAPAAPPK